GARHLPWPPRRRAELRRGPAEDVAVSERGGAVRVGSRTRDRSPRLHGLAIDVLRIAHGRVPNVRPDRFAVASCGCRIDVVAEELSVLVVLAAPAGITEGSAMHLGEPCR